MTSRKPTKEKQKRKSSPPRSHLWNNPNQRTSNPAYYANLAQSMSDAGFQAMRAPDTRPNNMIVRADTFPHEWTTTSQHPFNGVGGQLPRRDTDPNILAQDAMDRQVDRLYRIAALPPRKGHKYGTLKLGKNARAVRGNCFRGNNLEAQYLARSHEYGDAEAEDAAGLVDGDMQGEDLDDFFSGKTDAFHYGDDAQQQSQTT